MLLLCESTHHAGKKSLPPEENIAYRTEKKVLTVQRKFCLPAGENTPYRMMANSSYRA
jgi:hypothetical protein